MSKIKVCKHKKLVVYEDALDIVRCAFCQIVVYRKATVK